MLLCRPLGGFNDVLCQIERCASYATRTSRQLLIEIPPHSSTHYFLNLVDPSTISASTELNPHLGEIKIRDEDVFPAVLAGQLQDYEVRYQPTNNGAPWVEGRSGVKTTFDFRENYSERILVHHQSGGGPRSQILLRRLRLRSDFIQQIVDHIPHLPTSFNALHIRHSDLSSNFEKSIDTALRRSRGTALLVCSDSNVVLDYANQIPGTITFAEHQLPAPLHENPSGASREYLATAAERAVAEFVAMSRAKKFFRVVSTDASGNARFSGFSNLVAFAVRNGYSLPILRQFSPFLGNHRRWQGQVKSLSSRGYSLSGFVIGAIHDRAELLNRFRISKGLKP